MDPWGLKASGEIVMQGGTYSSLDAEIIQRRLNDLNYLGKNGKPLDVDGIIGSNTTYAIEKFQADQKITVDGMVGDVTWKRMGLMLNTDITEDLLKTTLRAIDENVFSFLPTEVRLGEEINNPYLLYLFYNTVRNSAPLDLKQVWHSEYFIFDGHVVRGDAPGNIAYGIAGKLLGISESLLLFGAGFAQQRAGTSDPSWMNDYFGDDPVDQFYIHVGFNYVESRRGK